MFERDSWTRQGDAAEGVAGFMESNNSQSANDSTPELQRHVRERFGVLPNFFRLSPETPEITEKLWGFAQAAYLDNPLPSVFKERLFVHLSRFCAVRYCIARHTGFLIGLGRPAGDKNALAEDAEDVVRLLRRPLPRGPELKSRQTFCLNSPAPIIEMPTADTQLEDALFSLASHVFLQTADAPECLDALEPLLGTVRLQYLLLLLAFVRAAHYWTRVHPEIQFEEDIKQLLATQEALASCILDDREASTDNVTQSILDELPLLRLRADKAIGLLASIVDSSDDAIISKTLDGVISSWNPGAEQLFGYTAQEAIGQSISMIIPLDRRDEETRILARLSQGERIDHFDTIRLRKDGTKLHISVSISPIKDATGKTIGASKIARDVTGRKRVERELQESEQRFRTLADALDTQVQFRTQELRRRNSEILQQSDQLRDLSGRLMLAQDEERRRIARELHDSVGQNLAALGMTLVRIEKDAKGEPSRLSESIKDAHDLVQDLLQEIRTTSYLLHPPMLEESGLLSALRWYTAGLTERSGLSIELNTPDNLERLAPEMELAIFRLVQECLTNIHRHSGSKTAIVRIAREPDKIYAEVQDQGRGMSQERFAEIQSQGVGVGIRGMRERVRHSHGELTIDSNALGTKITVVFPLKAPAS
ncbi:MAG TPA: PAS domain S-box protein [Candidatus Saccharimonadales bacterium]|nr:PAS domain S-box protein [Candidatus Saccharimonadales bacterium]